MTPQQEITGILKGMFDAWNAEDQADYLAHYSRGEDVRWSMQGRWYKGWSSMQQIYGRDYLPGAMGVIRMTDLEVMMLSDDVGVALYHWTHTLPTQSLAGSATHVFKRIDGAWRIVHENVARVPSGV